jgi:hypothetical protein
MLTRSQLFEVCQNTFSLPVMDVHGAACDNAAATVGSRFVRGNFDDEFLANWFGSLQSILADGDGVTAEARAFFDGHNVAYWSHRQAFGLASVTRSNPKEIEMSKQYIVTVAMQDGPAATVTVFALNSDDAKYRAAMKIESQGRGFTSHVIACRKC